MAVKRKDNGAYEIKNLKQAKEALGLFQTLKAEYDEIRQENDMVEMELDQVELKKAVTRWCIEAKVDRIQIDKTTHATLIEQAYDATFIGTDEEIPTKREDLLRMGLIGPKGEIRKVTSLRKIIKRKYKKNPKKAKEIWNQVTRRVVIKSEVEELVAEGILTIDDLAPCYVEKAKAPYLRIFESDNA